MTAMIQKFDRANGQQYSAEFWPTLTRLAELTGRERHEVCNLLLDGQEIATAGFVYRMLPADIAKVRDALREAAYDRIAMS